MSNNSLLGATFACDCGKTHSVPTAHFLYDEHSFDRLAELVQEYGSGGACLIIADTRTYEVAGKDVEDMLCRHNLKTDCFIVPDVNGESPVANDATKDMLLQQASPTDLYLAVGSGVINDLVKWVAYLRKKPYITIPTAASMNGYGSANVAATIDGLKVLFHAEAPKAVVVKPEIIISAPDELTASGLGDVLAKPVSSADWKLNQFLFGEYYCQYSVDLLKELEPVYLNNPEKIKNKDPEGFRALFEALFYSSIAMTITGTSSPASGGEHLISHTLDILAGRDGLQHDLHGLQVGVGSILTAALYERIMSIATPLFRQVPSSVNQDFWGTLTPIVTKEYTQKLPKLDRTVEMLSQHGMWNKLKETLQPMLCPAEKLKNCLRKAGAAHLYRDIRYNKEPLTKSMFLEAITNANQMRARFTVLDLAWLMGIIPDELDMLVEKWTSS